MPNNDVGEPAWERGAEAEYKVGYGKPPIKTRFQPGVSGNPKGRKAGRPNYKTIVERVAHRMVPVRQGDKTEWMPLIAAVLLGLALKGAKGDHKPGSAFIKEVKDAQDVQHENFSGLPVNSRPSAGLFINLDADLLTEDDMAELSRFASTVDIGGDITALKVDDFTLLQHLVNKGRGKDITPQP